MPILPKDTSGQWQAGGKDGATRDAARDTATIDGCLGTTVMKFNRDESRDAFRDMWEGRTIRQHGQNSSHSVKSLVSIES